MDGMSELELIAEIEHRERRLEAAREQLAHREGNPGEHEHLRTLEAELKEAVEHLNRLRRHGSQHVA